MKRRSIVIGLCTLFSLFAVWVATIMLANAVVKSRVQVSLSPFMDVSALGDMHVTVGGTWA